MKCDIYTTEHIVSECGVVLEESSMPDEMDDNDYALLDKEPEDIEDEAELKKWLLDEEELSERMEEAVADENYEYAKMYKDEIRRRKKKRRKCQMIDQQSGISLESLYVEY